jgi:hypothetical protein
MRWIPDMIGTAVRAGSLLAAAALALAAGPAAAQKAPAGFPAVWFHAASASPDFLDLFRHPEQWARARAQIQVMQFSVTQVDGRNSLIVNNLPDIIALDAFRKLRAWGIQIAVGAPSVKDWDCRGDKAEAYTVREILDVENNGGQVRFVSMDEPLVAGTSIVKASPCHLGVDQVAAEVAAYVQHITADPQVLAAGPAPQFVDVEPYPSVDVALMEQWVRAEEAHGYRPAALFLDVALHYVELKQQMPRMAADLRTLAAFLHGEHIPFGIVLWSGRDPVGSDHAYYQRVIDWTNFVHQSIGHPDAAVFSSWVTRCDGRNAGGDFACNRQNLACTPGDKFCGQKSVPINLPDNDPDVFSHTRLLLQSLGILRGP